MATGTVATIREETSSRLACKPIKVGVPGCSRSVCFSCSKFSLLQNRTSTLTNVIDKFNKTEEER